MSASGPTRLRNARRGRPSSRVGGRTDPALALLRQAEFWVDAARSPVVGGKLKNLGSGGSALDATFGSTAPSAYFDGTALVLPGVAANYASTPDAAALDITGDLEVVARVALDDWTPASINAVVGKWGSGAARSWYLRVSTGWTLDLTWTPDGLPTVITKSSTATLSSVGLVDGNTYWIKATLDVDNGASGNTVRFYYAADQPTEPTSWTQLGADVVTAGVTSIFAGTDALEVGTVLVGGSFPLAGKVRRTIVRNGIGGTTAFDADFAKPFDTTSFTATTGQTVTLNRSTSGTDTNDPTLLPHTGTNYLYLPGVSTNFVQAPDEAALDITGDFEIVVRVALDDWTPGAQSCLFSKFGGAGQRGWRLLVSAATGVPVLETSNDGTTLISHTATTAPPFVDGTTYWVKATIDVDNGAGGHTVRFLYAAEQATEPTSWTQLGSDVVTAGTTTNFANLQPLEIGSRGGGVEQSTGKFYRAIVRNGIGGTTVFDADFTTGITTGGQTTFTASTGQTVTINRATSGLKAVAVTRPVILLGTNDYFEVPDNALLNFGATDLGTFLAVVRLWNTEASGMALINKRDATAVAPAGPGWNLRIGGGVADTQFVTYDGTTSPQSGPAGTWTAGALTLHGGSLNGSSDQQWAFRNTSFGSTITSAVNTLTNTQTVRIGLLSNGASPLNGELVTVAVFRKILSAAEVAAINSYYGVA